MLGFYLIYRFTDSLSTPACVINLIEFIRKQYLVRIRYKNLPVEISVISRRSVLYDPEICIDRNDNKHLSDDQFRILAALLTIRKDEPIYESDFGSVSIPESVNLTVYDGHRSKRDLNESYYITFSVDQTGFTIEYLGKKKSWVHKDWRSHGWTGRHHIFDITEIISALFGLLYPGMCIAY